MAEYIKREALLKHKTLIPGFIGEYVHADRIKEAPAADVVPVVRCKDCKFYNTIDWDGDVLCGCKLKSGMVDITPDGYCSYGERKGAEIDG